eukprot:5241900-Prymnesium_polylepis.1
MRFASWPKTGGRAAFVDWPLFGNALSCFRVVLCLADPPGSDAQRVVSAAGMSLRSVLLLAVVTEVAAKVPPTALTRTAGAHPLVPLLWIGFTRDAAPAPNRCTFLPPLA